MEPTEIAKAREAYIKEVMKPSTLVNDLRCWWLERKLRRLLDEAKQNTPTDS